MPPSGSPSLAPPTRQERLRPPGSDWLYAKLYGPGDGQDELLADAVRSFGDFAGGSGLGQRWFFLRYADPAPHLRIRFADEPGQLLSSLLPRICAWAHDLLAGALWTSLAFDTYEREIERYGGTPAMELAEAIFAVDSGTAVELVHLLRGAPPPPLDRTTLTVLSTDGLLGALGLDAGRRLALYRDAVVTRSETSAEFRRRQRDLLRVLGPPDGDAGTPGSTELRCVLHARDVALAPIAERLHALANGGELTGRSTASAGASSICTATGCSAPRPRRSNRSWGCCCGRAKGSNGPALAGQQDVRADGPDLRASPDPRSPPPPVRRAEQQVRGRFQPRTGAPAGDIGASRGCPEVRRALNFW